MTELIEANNHVIDANQVRGVLISWGKDNFRALPWRVTRNPYKILISEIMLHRTQAKQVVPIYEQFVQAYPDLPTLARATKTELHHILYSLGLRWRIDLMLEMSREIMSRYKGKIPDSREDLLTLSGVSEYIAGAVRVFAWNLPEALVDTNTVRVIGRLFGLKIKDSSRKNRQFRDLLSALLDRENPRLYTYALLDLANKICTKKQKPACTQCPLKSWCLYAQQNNQFLA